MNILLPFLEVETDLSRKFITRYSNSTGHAIYSPNKEYQAFWSGDKGIIIFKNKLEIAHIDSKNNSSCLIANNGTLIFNSYDESGNTFYAFDAKSNLILNKRYQTALHENGLSPDGRYCVCQTVNSRNGAPDRSLLTAFDLTENKELFCIKNSKKFWADRYIFDNEIQGIHLFNLDKHLITYDLNSGAIK